MFCFLAQLPIKNSNVRSIVVVQNEITFNGVKSFAEETTASKIDITFKWIFPNGHECKDGKKMQNICMHLTSMTANGYLRLFEIDMTVMKDYMTETSWTLFRNFQEKHMHDPWICSHCNANCNDNENRWKCLRCLLWFHAACSKPQIISSSGNKTNYCLTCFFNL